MTFLHRLKLPVGVFWGLGQKNTCSTVVGHTKTPSLKGEASTAAHGNPQLGVAYIGMVRPTYEKKPSRT